MRRALVLTAGLCALAAGTLILRPSPAIRWLARRWPDVLLYVDTDKPIVALTIDDAPHPALTPASSRYSLSRTPRRPSS